MEQKVTFESDGLKLAGVVHTPANLSPGSERPAFLVLHGFGTGKDGSTPEILANMLCEWGYVVMRFDFRVVEKAKASMPGSCAKIRSRM